MSQFLSAPRQRTDYVDTDAGQVHLTTAGDGPPVVLMHWTPLSARMYEHELPRLADHGYKAIGVDLIGFGRSFNMGRVLPFERHADIVSQALKSSAVTSFAVLGAHFSAPIAVELALSSENEVTALLLDGCGHLLPEAEAKSIGSKVSKMVGPGLHDDGSHRTFLWEQAVNAYSIFDPAFEVNDRTLPLIYRFILDYLSTGLPEDFGTFQPYDMVTKLAAIAVPTCVLSAETDPLLPAQKPTVDALSKGPAPVESVTLTGGHPLHDPALQGAYADAIASFLKKL